MLNAEDLIFTMYALCDPLYDGPYNLGQAPIVGLEEYKSSMKLLFDALVEAGRENIGKHGIVRSQKVHVNVLIQIMEELQVNGLSLTALCPSPVKGGSGNIEYLACAVHSDIPPIAADVHDIAAKAFSEKK